VSAYRKMLLFYLKINRHGLVAGFCIAL